MIRLSNVRRRFGTLTAVDDLTADLPRGKTSVLIGPSGCGKSTVLRLLVGLITPDEGTISIDGAVLAPHNALELRKRMGYVIQSGGLFPHLSARDNAALPAEYAAWPRERVETRLAELLALTHLDKDILRRFPHQLSGGQRQRVALMRALMTDPDLLLLDEPMGALDPLIRADLQTDLKDIFETLGKTVVLVTHNLGEAAYLGHELLLLQNGRLLQRGTAEDLVRRPGSDFVTRFVNAQRSPLEAMT